MDEAWNSKFWKSCEGLINVHFITVKHAKSHVEFYKYIYASYWALIIQQA